MPKVFKPKERKTYSFRFTDVDGKPKKLSTGLTTRREAQMYADEYIANLKGVKSPNDAYRDYCKSFAGEAIYSLENLWYNYRNSPKTKSIQEVQYTYSKSRWDDFLFFS